MQYSEATNSRSVFNEILEWNIPGVILCITDRFFAILTNKPSQTWHTLLIPKRCGVQYSDFTREELLEYAILKQILIKALWDIYCTQENWRKIGEHVSWFEVRNHYHEHFIPAEKWTQVTLQWATEVSMEEREIEAVKIRWAIAWLKSQYSDIINFY